MKKKMNFIRAIPFLSLFTLVTLFPAVKTSADDIPPPGILPVILLSGSNYDMGYQYGLQAAHSIEINKTAAPGHLRCSGSAGTPLSRPSRPISTIFRNTHRKISRS